MTDNKNIDYSEIFFSFQGEGVYTGRSTAWLRFFLCNLQCNGFGQKDPTDPSTYVLPYKDIDISKYATLEQLPVFEYGCDSSYSWAKKFKHLVHSNTASEICDLIQNSMKHSSNPDGLFVHPVTRQDTHFAFTGGEPMLNQGAMAAIIREFKARGNAPIHVTVETNGTKTLVDEELQSVIQEYDDRSWMFDDEWFWSVSPKLFSTSGEEAKKAIKPEVVARYHNASPYGQLKYVVNGSEQSWDEVAQHTEAFRNVGVEWDVYIMPVGATKEQQESSQIAEIAVEAMKRGYHVSGRLHTYIFGNAMGT